MSGKICRKPINYGVSGRAHPRLYPRFGRSFLLPAAKYHRERTAGVGVSTDHGDVTSYLVLSPEAPPSLRRLKHIGKAGYVAHPTGRYTMASCSDRRRSALPPL